MKLTYRGNSYQTSAPIQLASDSKEVETDKPIATLIYRGNTYERKLQTPKPYQKPQAI